MILPGFKLTHLSVASLNLVKLKYNSTKKLAAKAFPSHIHNFKAIKKAKRQ